MRSMMLAIAGSVALNSIAVAQFNQSPRLANQSSWESQIPSPLASSENDMRFQTPTSRERLVDAQSLNLAPSIDDVRDMPPIPSPNFSSPAPKANSPIAFQSNVGIGTGSLQDGAQWGAPGTQWQSAARPNSLLQVMQCDECGAAAWAGYAAQRNAELARNHHHAHGNCNCLHPNHSLCSHGCSGVGCTHLHSGTAGTIRAGHSLSLHHPFQNRSSQPSDCQPCAAPIASHSLLQKLHQGIRSLHHGNGQNGMISVQPEQVPGCGSTEFQPNVSNPASDLNGLDSQASQLPISNSSFSITNFPAVSPSTPPGFMRESSIIPTAYLEPGAATRLANPTGVYGPPSFR